MEELNDWIIVDEPQAVYNVELLYKDEFYQILGRAFEIHNTLGKGFLEKVYSDALEVEFKLNLIPYAREKQFEIIYKEHKLCSYYADFVAYDKIIIEIKASENITDHHIAQTLNYLAASKCRLAIVLNFGGDKLRYKRVIR